MYKKVFFIYYYVMTPPSSKKEFILFNKIKFLARLGQI